LNDMKKLEVSWNKKDMITSGEDELVCPWCGYSDPDSFEIDPGEGQTDCPDCEKEFTYMIQTSVIYASARKLSPKEISAIPLPF